MWWQMLAIRILYRRCLAFTSLWLARPKTGVIYYRLQKLVRMLMLLSKWDNYGDNTDEACLAIHFYRRFKQRSPSFSTAIPHGQAAAVPVVSVSAVVSAVAVT
jgi:hypothetical protein